VSDGVAQGGAILSIRQLDVHRLLGGGELGLFRCADVAEERNAAIAGADQ